MLNTINNITLHGNLGKAPKFINNEKSSFVELSVATDKPIGINESTGKLKTIAEWHKVLIFDNVIIEQFKSFDITKGSKVRVEGALSYRKREIKDSNGDLITTVNEAYIFAGRVLPI